MGNTIPTYKDPYEEKLKGYLQQMEERKPFQYDVGSDALYQQLRDNYEQQGKLAMEDTMGKAAAMTGGYGNSYAQSVGQQVYNQHMQQLNDMVPDIYGMALDRYQQEGKDLQDKYDFYKGLSDESYNKYLMENGLLSGNNGADPIEYTTLSREEQDAWSPKIARALEGEGATFGSLTTIFDYMTYAKHNPWESANFILSQAKANNITPTKDELEEWGEMLKKAGYSDDEVSAFIIDWHTLFGLPVEKKEPILSQHIIGGSGGGGGYYLTTPV